MTYSSRAEPWRSLTGVGARVLNLYGASEVGGRGAGHAVGGAELGRAAIAVGGARSGPPRVPLDAPSPSRAPVADGMIGELCVAGPAVARGYVPPQAGGRAQFVDLPGDDLRLAGDAAGIIDVPPRRSRWFRTGDLARRGDGGALELV